MSLQLIPMCIDTTKEIPSAVHVENHSPPGIIDLLPHLKIRPHLDPLGRHLAPGLPPLPPLLPTDPLDAMRAQLGLDGFGAGSDMCSGDRDMVKLHPARRRYPLACEALQVLDGVVRSVEEEFLDQVQALVVGDVLGGLVRKALLAVEILEGLEG